MSLDVDPFVAREKDALLPEKLDHAVFLSETWSADDFLLTRRHTALEDLRSELRAYLAQLRTELVGVINEDYEDFIGLGIGLRGTDQRIDRIVQPVEGLKVQVDSLRSGLSSIQQDIQGKLLERNQIRSQKATLKLLLSVHESVAKVEAFLLIRESSKGGVREEPPSENVSEPPEPGRKALQFSEPASNGESISPVRTQRIERIATEYNQLLYLLKKSEGNKCVEALQPRIHRITEALHDNLRTALTQALHAIHERHGHSKQVDAHKSRRESLSECFKAYELLGKSREAEEVVRKEMVRPWVDQHVHRDALSGSQTPVLPQTPHTDKHFHFTSPNPSESAPFAGINGSVAPESVSHSFASTYQIDPLPHPTDYQDVLVELFNKILAFISKDCAPVLEATERKGALPSGGEQAARLSGSDVPTYNVLANVIVDELLNRLASDLGHVIFAAGRPDIFSHNYTTSGAFLNRLEGLCSSAQQVTALRNHPSYVAFMRRWQLPVYFQLRFREIAGRLEGALASKDASTINSVEAPFLLPTTEAAHRAIWSCWQPDIVLYDLIPRFWRLTLQLISRHRTYVNANLRPLLNDPAKQNQPEKTSNTNSRSATPLPPDAMDDASVRLLTVYIADLQRYESAVLDLFSDLVAHQLPAISITDMEDSDSSPEAVLRASLASTMAIIPLICQHIVAALVRACAEPLRSIRSVASQIRASNRKVGSEPSYFVPAILKPLRDYQSGIGKLISPDRRNVWSAEIIGEIANRYTAVLTEMRKTDDSLKRFRRGRTGFSLFGNKTNAEEAEKSEEDRVKIQMQADVQAFINEATAMGVAIQDSPELVTLQNTAAEK